MPSWRPVAVRALAVVTALGIWSAAAAGWRLSGSPAHDTARRASPISDGSAAGRTGFTVDPSQLACDGPRRFDALLNGTGPFCVPKDQIRAIDAPTFVSARRARFLPPVEPVVALDLGGESRAYPIRVLLFREVVNDVVAGQPVVVTYCPLCDSAVAFSRRVAGRTLVFGVSGQLQFANLLMFDRQTGTLWQQLTGNAVRNTGPLSGQRLSLVPVQLVSFRDWRAAHPDGLVMTEPKGSGDPYGRDAYSFYDHGPDEPSIVVRQEHVDPRLPPKWRVTGVFTPDGAVAFAAPRGMGTIAVRAGRVGATPLVAFFAYGAAQADRTYYLKDAPPGWSASVWDARLDGRTLSFVAGDGAIVETGTGSRFDFFGRGVSGPLAGRRLLPVPQVSAFWFAWAHFFPGTGLVRG